MGHHRQPGKRRFRPGRDWLVIAAIIVGGNLIGWASGIGFAHIIDPAFGGDAGDWFPWWIRIYISFQYFAVAVFVLAAAYYWFRRRAPDNKDPGA